MSNAGRGDRIIPARLSFLSIYNPSLGRTDETFREQILYYYSRSDRESRLTIKSATGATGKTRTQNAEELREQENERLRQIGLAQGMVDFAKTFSEGRAVETVETEKSRIILHELENEWWILAVR